MRFVKLVIRPAAMGAIMFLAAAGGAKSQQVFPGNMSFDVRLSGWSVGRMDLTVEADRSSYSVGAVLKTTGLASMFKKIDYQAMVEGRLVRGRFVPAQFAEHAIDGSETSYGAISYVNGAPSNVQSSPPKPVGTPRAPMSRQAGTVDPLTAVFVIVRDVSRDELCDQDYPVFDGVRRTRILLNVPREEDDGTYCDGAYIRVDGYKEEDLAEQTDYPFTLLFEEHPDQEGRFRLMKLTARSEEGSLEVLRRPER